MAPIVHTANALVGSPDRARVANALAGARRYVAGRLPVLHLRDGSSMADFEIVQRLGARARPAIGSRYYGVNSAVFQCVHVASRAVVAVKLMLCMVRALQFVRCVRLQLWTRL